MRKLILITLWLFISCDIVSAEIVRSTDVVLSDADFASLPDADLQLDFFPPAGFPELEDGLLLLSDELDVEGFTLGGEVRLVIAEAGDVLTQSNLESFASALTASTSDSPFGTLGIPEGDSFVGFGLRPRSDEVNPYHSIGWIQFRRTSDGLELLDNAVNHGILADGSIGPSTGITVGVPEPMSSGAFTIGLVIVLAFRRTLRTRQSPSGVKQSTEFGHWG